MTNKNRANNVSRLKKIISSVKKLFSRASSRKQKLRNQQTIIEEQKKLIQQLQKSQTEQEEQIRVLNERMEQSEKSQSETAKPKKIKKQSVEIKEEKASDFFPQKHGSRFQARLDFEEYVKYGMNGWSTKTVIVNVSFGEQGKTDIQHAQSIKEAYEEEGNKVKMRFLDLENEEEVSLDRLLELMGE